MLLVKNYLSMQSLLLLVVSKPKRSVFLLESFIVLFISVTVLTLLLGIIVNFSENSLKRKNYISLNP